MKVTDRETPPPALYLGRVTHERLTPVVHLFQYRVFSVLLDLDLLDQSIGRLRFFSRGRFNLFSFYDRDYGEGRPGTLVDYIRDVLAESGVDAGGPIKLLCYPRILGYAFNPLAIYYCYDCEGALAAMIYEVRNTFGDRHAYLIPCDSRAVRRSDEAATRIDQEADKQLHVSPFMEMDMRYRFLLREPGKIVSTVIRQADREGPIFNAAFRGARRPLTDRSLLLAFFSYPLMTLKVIFGIHWQAVRLLLKGMKLLPEPPAPDTSVTVVRGSADGACQRAA